MMHPIKVLLSVFSACILLHESTVIHFNHESESVEIKGLRPGRNVKELIDRNKRAPISPTDNLKNMKEIGFENDGDGDGDGDGGMNNLSFSIHHDVSHHSTYI